MDEITIGSGHHEIKAVQNYSPASSSSSKEPLRYDPMLGWYTAATLSGLLVLFLVCVGLEKIKDKVIEACEGRTHRANHSGPVSSAEIGKPGTGRPCIIVTDRDGVTYAQHSDLSPDKRCQALVKRCDKSTEACVDPLVSQSSSRARPHEEHILLITHPHSGTKDRDKDETSDAGDNEQCSAERSVCSSASSSCASPCKVDDPPQQTFNESPASSRDNPSHVMVSLNSRVEAQNIVVTSTEIQSLLANSTHSSVTVHAVP